MSEYDFDYVDEMAAIQAEIDKYHSYEKYGDKNELTIAMVEEYLTLYLNGEELTSGEVEVLQRLKDINRENAYY